MTLLSFSFNLFPVHFTKKDVKWSKKEVQPDFKRYRWHTYSKMTTFNVFNNFPQASLCGPNRKPGSAPSHMLSVISLQHIPPTPHTYSAKTHMNLTTAIIPCLLSSIQTQVLHSCPVLEHVWYGVEPLFPSVTNYCTSLVSMSVSQTMRDGRIWSR